MLGRNNEGAKIVVSKFEGSLTGESEEIEDALGNALSIRFNHVRVKYWEQSWKERLLLCRGGPNRRGTR